MWYVIQVLTGEEEKTAARCRRVVGAGGCGEEVLGECFIPYAVRQKKYRGEWHREQRVLFPGYVFLTSSRPEELFLELKKVSGLTRLLGTGQEIVPLSKEEEEFLRRIGGEGQVVECSTGFLEQDRIRITDGPLQGLEGCIRKIDRHKRTAWLKVPMMGRVLEVQVGLEVVEKRQEHFWGKL